ncbi:MAG TPA: MarR family transcriptional regulator [Acidimicrobiia bacterium]|nr:MarR family transcriptional regulator [Acidimicrobiia bacterium]
MAEGRPVPAARVGMLARRLVRALTDQTREELAAAGFTDLRPVHQVLFALLRDGGRRITDMATLTRVTKQAVTLMVDHLEAGGYVARAADPADRRAKLVVLTERGRAAAAASEAIVDRIDAGFAARLGADRLDDLKATLRELVASLERPDAGPGAGRGSG